VFKLNKSHKYVVIKEENETAVIEQVWECDDAIGYPKELDQQDKNFWRELFKAWLEENNAPKQKLKELVNDGGTFLQ
jgi:hypothetical protein